MNARLPSLDIRATVLIAAFAALASIVLLASVVDLFTVQAAPLAAGATAQRAGADRVRMSERDACAQADPRAARRAVVARR